MKGLGTAFRTLTVISWPGEKDEDFSASLPWFPVVGLVLGLVLYAIAHIWTLLPFSQWTTGAALLIVAAEIWLTRGLHLDGLADWADSVAGGNDREKRLAIMKDVRLGAFGVLAVILAVMAKWLAFERILSAGSAIWVLFILIVSRDMMIELITTLPYARSGEGMARPFVTGASEKHRQVAHLLSLGFCIPFGPLGLVFMVLARLLTWVFRSRCQSRFGGITGDLIGTANEMVEISLLGVCALGGKGILFYTGWAWVFL